MSKRLLPVLAALCLMAAPMFAQDFRSEVSVQGTANFNNSTNNIFSPSSPNPVTGGFLTGYRYHLSPHFAVQGDYGFTRDRQTFLNSNLFNGIGSVQTNVHQLMGSVVFSGSGKRVRPYVLAGGGGLFFRPTNPSVNTLFGLGNTFGLGGSQTKPAFLYGGGLDISLTRFLALRGEYRGLLFNAPGFQIPGLSFLGIGTPGISHLAEPSVGLVWRF